MKWSSVMICRFWIKILHHLFQAVERRRASCPSLVIVAVTAVPWAESGENKVSDLHHLPGLAKLSLLHSTVSRHFRLSPGHSQICTIWHAASKVTCSQIHLWVSQKRPFLLVTIHSMQHFLHQHIYQQIFFLKKDLPLSSDWTSGFHWW